MLFAIALLWAKYNVLLCCFTRRLENITNNANKEHSSNNFTWFMHFPTLLHLKSTPPPYVFHREICIGGGTVFHSGGGAIFLEVKNGPSAPAVALARRRGCLRGDVHPWEVKLFWKCGLKWSDLVHYFSSC